MYNINMNVPLRLLWKTIAPRRPYHAALVIPHAAVSTCLHCHDFHEMLYVKEGTGEHQVNGQVQRLTAGELLLIRPADCHAFQVRPGQSLHFINIAFCSDLWADYVRLAALPEWETAALPPKVSLPPTHRAEAAQAFSRALRGFYAGMGQAELCRFWGIASTLLCVSEQAVSQWLYPQEEAVLAENAPAWLVQACLLMVQEEHLREGYPRLLDLAGMSETHIARTLKKVFGLSPTAWINRERVRRAGLLLSTTQEPIASIALDCGFDNLSYFYRCFGRHFGHSPRLHRQGMRHQIVP